MAKDIGYYEISKYKLFLSRMSFYVPGGKQVSRVAYIYCTGANESTDVVRSVIINFIESEGGIPANETLKVGNQYIVRMFWKESCYAWFIDLLRNEGPVWVSYSPSDPSRNGLQTGPEPIGEMELLNE